MSMIHEITAAVGANKKRTRRGRGEGSGKGKTCGRGTKGTGARGQKPIKHGHEGGQTPIYRRLPTRGFSNDIFERRFQIVNVDSLNRFEDGTTVDASTLVAAGLVADARQPVKILGDGALTRRLTVQAAWFSRSAHEKIAAAGGIALDLQGQAFAFPKPKFRPRPAAQGEGGGKKSAKPVPQADAPEAKPAE